MKSAAATTVFDFDVGTLIESPCRSCAMRKILPNCVADCQLLSQIQTILAAGVSSNISVSTMEAYCIADPERQ
jgi:hypothetical protein